MLELALELELPLEFEREAGKEGRTGGFSAAVRAMVEDAEDGMVVREVPSELAEPMELQETEPEPAVAPVLIETASSSTSGVAEQLRRRRPCGIGGVGRSIARLLSCFSSLRRSSSSSRSSCMSRSLSKEVSTAAPARCIAARCGSISAGSFFASSGCMCQACR